MILVIFLGGVFFFGWQIERFVFKINRIELLLPLSAAIGCGFYIFFLNILSYLIPITLNFYLIFITLLIVAFSLFFLNRQRISLGSGLNKKESWLVFSMVLIIIILSGILVSRSIEADDLAYTRLPVASSIAGGNFPVKNLNIPEEDLTIHYGPYLFYAAVSKITGFSVLTSFRLSIFLFSGIILLLLFNIAKLFIKNNIASFLVALVGMFGGGFRFIYGFSGLITLYKKFILHYNIEHPFAFFSDIWSVSPITGSLIGHIFSGLFALGWVLALAVICLYLKNISNKKWFYFSDFIIIVLMSVLALTFEMGFIAICFGIFATPFIFYFKDRNKEDFKLLFKHSLLILSVIAVLVLFQGGTITAILKNIIQHESSYGVGLGFSIFKNPFAFDLGNGTTFPFYSPTFILNFGLIYFLIIPAIVFIIKKQLRESIFLIVISCFAFLIPLFVSFNGLWQQNFDRFFRFNSVIWSILVGLFFMTILLQLNHKDLFKKLIVFACLIVICLEGVTFFLTRPLYKRDEYRLNNDSFFAVPRSLSMVESIAYGWVKKNSAIKDYFLVFADKNDIGDENSVLENFRFVMFTQRFAPIYTYSYNNINLGLPEHKYYTPHYKRLISDCNKDDMKILNYRYLFVDNNWPNDLEEKCLANNNLELKFGTKEGDEFLRIYKVK